MRKEIKDSEVRFNGEKAGVSTRTSKVLEKSEEFRKTLRSLENELFEESDIQTKKMKPSSAMVRSEEELNQSVIYMKRTLQTLFTDKHSLKTIVFKTFDYVENKTKTKEFQISNFHTDSQIDFLIEKYKTYVISKNGFPVNVEIKNATFEFDNDYKKGDLIGSEFISFEIEKNSTFYNEYKEYDKLFTLLEEVNIEFTSFETVNSLVIIVLLENTMNEQTTIIEINDLLSSLFINMKIRNDFLNSTTKLIRTLDFESVKNENDKGYFINTLHNENKVLRKNKEELRRYNLNVLIQKLKNEVEKRKEENTTEDVVHESQEEFVSETDEYVSKTYSQLFDFDYLPTAAKLCLLQIDEEVIEDTSVYLSHLLSNKLESKEDVLDTLRTIKECNQEVSEENFKVFEETFIKTIEKIKNEVITRDPNEQVTEKMKHSYGEDLYEENAGVFLPDEMPIESVKSYVTFNHLFFKVVRDSSVKLEKLKKRNKTIDKRVKTLEEKISNSESLNQNFSFTTELTEIKKLTEEKKENELEMEDCFTLRDLRFYLMLKSFKELSRLKDNEMFTVEDFQRICKVRKKQTVSTILKHLSHFNLIMFNKDKTTRKETFCFVEDNEYTFFREVRNKIENDVDYLRKVDVGYTKILSDVMRTLSNDFTDNQFGILLTIFRFNNKKASEFSPEDAVAFSTWGSHFSIPKSSTERILKQLHSEYKIVLATEEFDKKDIRKGRTKILNLMTFQ